MRKPVWSPLFIYLFIYLFKILIFFSCVLFFILTSDDIASFDRTGGGGGAQTVKFEVLYGHNSAMKKLWNFLKPDMELWTNKLLLSFKFDNSVKFDKPSYEIQQTDRRSRALPNTACALPPPPLPGPERNQQPDRPDAKRHPAHFAGNRAQAVQQRPAHHQKNGWKVDRKTLFSLGSSSLAN